MMANKGVHEVSLLIGVFHGEVLSMHISLPFLPLILNEAALPIFREAAHTEFGDARNRRCSEPDQIWAMQPHRHDEPSMDAE
jgi:hypothetical protein